MKTEFSLAQLADPDIAEADKILRACVHCGFCTATCPTFLLTGDELDSPRGRIYLIKDMLENGKPATEEVVKHVDRCLSCLSCMTTCPSGVDYRRLVDTARAHIERTYRRPAIDRLMRGALAALVPYPARFRWALRLAALGRPFAPLVARLPKVGPRLAAMLALAPARLPAAEAPAPAPVGPRRGRVALMAGCAQSVLAPSINAAAARLLARAGYEVVAAAGEGCCGSLVLHMGREADAKAAARANVDAWLAEAERGLEAIVVTASGCGATVKDYGHLLADDPAYADKAKRVAALAKDVSEFAAGLDLGAPARQTGLGVAYHAACSMQHALRLRTEPKAALAKAGFSVREPAEGHLCCGSAGVYNILQPEIAGRLRARKRGNLLKIAPDVIASGNIGCLTQLASRPGEKGPPVVHTVELLDWAYGGPAPAGLAERGGGQ
jgi:glycolate oxidase iron-sulfur subunit